MSSPHHPQDITEKIYSIIVDILDISPNVLTPQTYVIRELDTESIDLLEYGVALNATFGIPVHDDTVFLRSLRTHLLEAQHTEISAEAYLATWYPHLSATRIVEIIHTVDQGPVLRIQDITDYVRHTLNKQEQSGHVS